MATLNTTAASTLGILINNLPSNGYKSNADTDITVTVNGQANDLLKEANYLLSTGIPANVIDGSIDISIAKSTLNQTAQYIGVRLVSVLASDANASKFKFAADSAFSTYAPIVISASTAPVSLANTIWSDSTIAYAASGNLDISVDVSYIASNNTPGDNVTYIVEFYETDNTSTGTPVLIGSVSQTTDTSAALSITSYSAEVTSVMTAYDPTNLTTAKTSYYRNDAIALQTALTTNTADYYKHVSTISVELDIPTAVSIGSGFLYVTTLTAPANVAALDTDAASGTGTVKIDLSNTTGQGVTIVGNTITLAMPTGTVYDKVFTATGSTGTLKTPVSVYVTGNLSGI